MRKARTATALLLTGPAGSTWGILTADGVVLNAQFDDPPVITGSERVYRSTPAPARCVRSS
jgi:hypothetical protein